MMNMFIHHWCEHWIISQWILIEPQAIYYSGMWILNERAIGDDLVCSVRFVGEGLQMPVIRPSAKVIKNLFTGMQFSKLHMIIYQSYLGFCHTRKEMFCSYFSKFHKFAIHRRTCIIKVNEGVKCLRNAATRMVILSLIDGLEQYCSNSIANALELLQPCTKPSICGDIINADIHEWFVWRILRERVLN